MVIVEADLKCRNQIVHGVRECHVKLPPATSHVDLDPITLEPLGDSDNLVLTFTCTY